MLQGKKILLGITGSIAAYKACELISLLKKRGAEVRVIATDSALEFVGKASLEGLSDEKVLTSDFSDGTMMEHITLAKWADVFVIAPASAQSINALAQGAGHGILVSTYLAYDLKKPLLLAPAMNTVMLEHPTTQASLQKLQNFGIQVLETDAGNLACGDVGLGRLISPERILEKIITVLTPAKKLSILITAGGTKVPIDNVRAITNTSTGQTGAALADFFAQKNYSVDLLMSKSGRKPKWASSVSYFETYDDLKNLMQKKLSEKTYDYVFHAAAVSDYEVDHISDSASGGKLPSGKTVQVSLKPTEKIVSHIKEWSPKSQVVAFKLTSTTDEDVQKKAIRKLFEQPVDWVIHNDTHEISDNNHIFHIYGKSGAVATATSKDNLPLNIESSILPKEFL